MYKRDKENKEVLLWIEALDINKKSFKLLYSSKLSILNFSFHQCLDNHVYVSICFALLLINMEYTTLEKYSYASYLLFFCVCR